MLNIAPNSYLRLLVAQAETLAAAQEQTVAAQTETLAAQAKVHAAQEQTLAAQRETLAAQAQTLAALETVSMLCFKKQGLSPRLIVCLRFEPSTKRK